MRRETKFVMSHKPYAILLDTVSGECKPNAWNRPPLGLRYSFSGSCEAMWFRRKYGVTRVCIGPLMLFAHNLMSPPDRFSAYDRTTLEPGADRTAALGVLQADLDGRYGGDAMARWDGTSYWGSSEPDTIASDLVTLGGWLTRFPDVPDGYSGWWSFNA